MNYFFIFLGGGAGSLLRFGLGQWFLPLSMRFPAATLLANVVASVIIAVVFNLTYEKNTPTSATLWSLVAIGFCGGLSTFSTFSLETVRLIRDGMITYAFLNIAISIAMCVGLVWMMVRK